MAAHPPQQVGFFLVTTTMCEDLPQPLLGPLRDVREQPSRRAIAVAKKRQIDRGIRKGFTIDREIVQGLIVRGLYAPGRACTAMSVPSNASGSARWQAPTRPVAARAQHPW